MVKHSTKVALVLCLYAAAFLVISLATFSWLFSSPYDRKSTEFKYLDSVLASERKVLELAKFSNGDFQLLCVIGPYNNPAKILRAEAQKRGIQISVVDEISNERLELGQTQAAVSFVDRLGRGHTILYPGAFTLAGEHAFKCYGPGTIEIPLPVNDIGPYGAR